MATQKLGFNDEEGNNGGPNAGKHELATADASGLQLTDLSWSELKCYGASSQFSIPGVNIGDICMDKELVVVPEGSRAQFIVLCRDLAYKEKVEYGGEMGMLFNSLEEARMSGVEYIPYCNIAGLLKWDPDGPVSEDDASAAFPFEVGGSRFALAKYYVQKKKAVEENYPRIATHELASGGRAKQYMLLRTVEKNFKSNSWRQFVISPSGAKVEPEVTEFISNLASLSQ